MAGGGGGGGGGGGSGSGGSSGGTAGMGPMAGTGGTSSSSGSGASAAAGYVGAAGAGAALLARFVGELSPAAIAQRREAKKARKRLEAGVGYGMSQGEKDALRSEANQQTASLLAAQQAALARQQAAGGLGGGAGAEANRAIAQQALAANAQNEANVQKASNAVAQQEYANDTGLVAQQAAHGRELWSGQAQTALQTTQGAQGADTAAAAQDYYQRRQKAVGTPAPAAPATATATE